MRKKVNFGIFKWSFWLWLCCANISGKSKVVKELKALFIRLMKQASDEIKLKIFFSSPSSIFYVHLTSYLYTYWFPLVSFLLFFTKKIFQCLSECYSQLWRVVCRLERHQAVWPDLCIYLVGKGNTYTHDPSIVSILDLLTICLMTSDTSHCNTRRLSPLIPERPSKKKEENWIDEELFWKESFVIIEWAFSSEISSFCSFRKRIK